MQKQIAALKVENTKLQADLKKKGEEISTESKQLRTLVDDATKLVTHNSADFGQTVQKLQVDVAALSGRVDDMSTTVTALGKSFNDFRASSDVRIEKMQNESTTAKAPPIPENADGVYGDAKKRLDAKQYVDARRLLDAFIARYPTDSRAAMAQYLIGDSYLKETKYANAINAFLKVIEGYPKSEAVPDAMYEAGESFYSLKYCGDARVYFQELLRRYPKTEWKKDANQKLKDIQRDLKNRAVCTS